MESRIPSENCEPIRPTMEEFKDFSTFIRNLELKGITFALVSRRCLLKVILAILITSDYIDRNRHRIVTVW